MALISVALPKVAELIEIHLMALTTQIVALRLILPLRAVLAIWPNVGTCYTRVPRRHHTVTAVGAVGVQCLAIRRPAPFVIAGGVARGAV